MIRIRAQVQFSSGQSVKEQGELFGLCSLRQFRSSTFCNRDNIELYKNWNTQWVHKQCSITWAAWWPYLYWPCNCLRVGMNLGCAVRGSHDCFICTNPATVFGLVWIWAVQYAGRMMTLFVLTLQRSSGQYEFGLCNTWAALWLYLYWPCDCIRVGMNLDCAIHGPHDDFICTDPATVFGSVWIWAVQYAGRMMTLFVLILPLSSDRDEWIWRYNTWAAWWSYLYWSRTCLRVGMNSGCAVREPHDDFICIDPATVFGSV